MTASTTDPSIFGGAKDDDSDAIPGVVALRVGSGTTFELCSGALIAPNVVLTARHCVTKNATTSVACDENGSSANGPPRRRRTRSRRPSASTSARRRASRSPASPRPRHRRADRPVPLRFGHRARRARRRRSPTSLPLAVRIHARRAQGRDDPLGRLRPERPELAHRYALPQGRRRTSSRRARRSPPSKTPLGTHEFEVGKSICQGDSGGPAISEETGAVIGVVSRGGGCDDDFGHIYTTTAGFDQMFADAFALAGATPTDEVGDGSATTREHAFRAATPPRARSTVPSRAQAAGCSRPAPRRAARKRLGIAGLAIVARSHRAARRASPPRSLSRRPRL